MFLAACALITFANLPALTAEQNKALSPALKQALKDIQALDGPEAMALASWLSGEGRSKLKTLGATDAEIGPARFNVDRFGEAPLGK